MIVHMESQNSNSKGILSAHRLWGHTREGSGNTRTAGTARAEVWGWFGNVALYRFQKKSHPDGQNPGTFTGIYIYTCTDIHTDTHIYIYTICIFQCFKKVGNFGRAELIERIASDLGCCSLIFPNDFTLMYIYICICMNFIDKLVDRAESLADEVEILSVHAKYESVRVSHQVT